MRKGYAPTAPAIRLARRLERDEDTGCENWTGHLSHNGYGRTSIGSKADNTYRNMAAHRLAYELRNGPVPNGLQLDHLCRNRRCCNPDHLEPVTPAENWRRGNVPSAISVRTGLCKRGHVMDDANVVIGGRRRTRQCRICKREYMREYMQRKRALAQEGNHDR